MLGSSGVGAVRMSLRRIGLSLIGDVWAWGVCWWLFVLGVIGWAVFVVVDFVWRVEGCVIVRCVL